VLFFHYVLRKLIRRLGNNALTIAVIGFVLAGCILGIEFLIGLRSTARESLPAEHVIVMSKGAISEPLSSGIPAESLNLLAVMPGIAEHDGERAMSPELVAQVVLDDGLTQSGIEEPQVIRGLDPLGFQLHRATIVSGRAPEPGATELVIGAQLAKQQPKLVVGSEIRFPTESWKIVGVFAAGGSLYETEAWGDRKRIAVAFKQDRVTGVLLAASSASEAAALVKTINESKRFDVTAYLERDLRASQAKLQQVTKVIFILVLALCIIGVFVTATNLHASLISRMPELVTLVALGISRKRVARIMLLESVLLAMLGLVVAIAIALAFHGRSSAMFGSAAVFELQLGLYPILFVLGLTVLVSLLGGLVPVMMVRRIDLVRGLR
jgi:putative ABC transport system permease protein